MKISNKHLTNTLFAIIILAALLYLTSEKGTESIPKENKIELVKPNVEHKIQPEQKSEQTPEETPPGIPVASPQNIYAPDNSSGFEQKMLNNSGSESLNNSLNQIQGEAVTTEAIIERNAYFKKLSEQMKELQGGVSSESSGNNINNSGGNNPTQNLNTNNEIILDDEADIVDDPESSSENEELDQLLDE